ncbi:hypothetical protein [Azospirillum doebereinerae]
MSSYLGAGLLVLAGNAVEAASCTPLTGPNATISAACTGEATASSLSSLVITNSGSISGSTTAAGASSLTVGQGGAAKLRHQPRYAALFRTSSPSFPYSSRVDRTPIAKLTFAA